MYLRNGTERNGTDPVPHSYVVDTDEPLHTLKELRQADPATVPLILNVGTRRNCVASFTLRLPYLLERTP